MAIKQVVIVKADGFRKNIDDNKDNILNNVDLQDDLLTTPKDLFRQFIAPPSLARFDTLDLEAKITRESLTNDNFTNSLISSFEKIANKNSGIIYDNKLLTVFDVTYSKNGDAIATSQRLKGKALFMEQYNLEFRSVSDTKFTEIYEVFKQDLKENSPSFLTFVSKSDVNKTIIVTTSTKILRDFGDDKKIEVAYDQKGYDENGVGKISFSSEYTSSRPNPVYTAIARSLFRAVEKIGGDDTALALDRGVNQAKVFKGTFFDKNNPKEWTFADAENEITADKILKQSKDVTDFDNNTKRGSMSPNTSKDYIESKNIDEEIFELTTSGLSKIDALLKLKDTLESSDEQVSEEANEKLEVVNSLLLIEEGNEENSHDEITEVKVTESEQLNTSEPIKIETVNIKPIEANNTKTQQTPQAVVVEEDKINNFIDNVMLDLNTLEQQELIAIDQSIQRKKEEAPALAKKMLEEFKINIVKSGDVISNIDKINQSYRDNDYAFVMFKVLVKTELVKSVHKDVAIGKLTNFVHDMKKDNDAIKTQYEEKMASFVSQVKNLQESNNSLVKEKEELENEYDEYVDYATNELKPKIEALETQLTDYNKIKEEDEAKNQLLEGFSKKIEIIEKDNFTLRQENEYLKKEVKNLDALRDLTGMQKTNIEQLQNENKSLREQFSVQKQTISQLESTLKHFKEMNAKLQEELNQMDVKIQMGEQLVSTMKETKEIVRTTYKKDQQIQKIDEKIILSTPITKEEATVKANSFAFGSKEWHRLSFLALNQLDLESSQFLSNSVEFKNGAKVFIKELVDGGLAYLTDTTVTLKDKARIVLYENPSDDIVSLKEKFTALEEKTKYTEPKYNKYNKYNKDRE